MGLDRIGLDSFKQRECGHHGRSEEEREATDGSVIEAEIEYGLLASRHRSVTDFRESVAY